MEHGRSQPDLQPLSPDAHPMSGCLEPWPQIYTTPMWELCSFSRLGPWPWLSQPCRRCCRQAVLLPWLKIAQS